MLKSYEKLQFIDYQPDKFFTAPKIIAERFSAFLCTHQFWRPYRTRPQSQDFCNGKAVL